MQAKAKPSLPAFYHWDFDTDQITWFGDDAYFLDNLASTGQKFAKQINKIDRINRYKAINKLDNYNNSINLRYHVNLFEQQEFWVEESSKVDESQDGNIKSIIGKINFLNAPELQTMAKRAFFQSRSRQSDSNIKRSITKAHRYNAAISKNYGYIILMFGEGLSEQSNINSEFSTSITTALRKCIRTTDTVHKISNLAWLIIFDASTSLDLQYYEKIIHNRVNLVEEDREFYTHYEALDPSISTVNEQLDNIRKQWQYVKYQLDKLMITKSTVIDISNCGNNTLKAMHEIEQAIVEKRLCIAFQPIVDTITLQPIYYECLARIIGKDGKVIPAGQFINLCERSGLIKKLDIYILQMVLVELLRNKKLCLSVNLSAITATDPEWIQLLSTYVKSWPHLANRLVVELTETAIFFDLQESLRFMEQVHSLGCKIAIDDFGAGYLSFSHLNSELTQIVKLDGSIIKDLKHSKDSIWMIRTLLSLIRPHKIRCVAEFVEDIETVEILRQEGVDYLQGFYIGKGEIIRP
jgi:EAL domain-containing protein (putative c-di-GMP-specific phosphodiesterase class I)/GTP-binding protein EngB required for normal cell division